MRRRQRDLSQAPPPRAGAGKTFAIPICAIALWLGAGCTRPALRPFGDDATPRPAAPGTIAESSFRAIWKRFSRAPERPASPVIEMPDPMVEATELAAEFDRETEEARRTEIVFQLAINASPHAQQLLDRIYRDASDVEMKINVIEALPFADSNEMALRMALLRDALAPDQPAELRDAAVESLRQFEKPVVLPLWQALANDADESVRAAAEEMVAYLATLPRELTR